MFEIYFIFSLDQVLILHDRGDLAVEAARASGRAGGARLTIIMVHHNHTHQSPCRLMTLQGGINLRHDSQETRKIDTAAQLKYF